jgi:hypothetical protein
VVITSLVFTISPLYDHFIFPVNNSFNLNSFESTEKRLTEGMRAWLIPAVASSGSEGEGGEEVDEEGGEEVDEEGGEEVDEEGGEEVDEEGGEVEGDGGDSDDDGNEEPCQEGYQVRNGNCVPSDVAAGVETIGPLGDVDNEGGGGELIEGAKTMDSIPGNGTASATQAQGAAEDIPGIPVEPTTGYREAKGSETAESIPGAEPTTGIQEAKGSETMDRATSTNSREELLNKVSTEKELIDILDKFRDFLEDSPSDFTSVSGYSKGVITTEPTSSVKIYYAWEPSQIIKEKYSILMLKFTDASDESMKKKIDYTISIKDGTDSVLNKVGSTTTGADLKIIDENTFPIGSAINPANYDMNITIPSIDNIPVNEYIRPLIVNVVSENS